MKGKVPFVLIQVHVGEGRDFSYLERCRERALPAVQRVLQEVKREMNLIPVDSATEQMLHRMPMINELISVFRPERAAGNKWSRLIQSAHAGLCYWNGKSEQARRFKDYAARHRFPLRLFFSDPLLELVYYGGLATGETT